MRLGEETGRLAQKGAAFGEEGIAGSRVLKAIDLIDIDKIGPCESFRGQVPLLDVTALDPLIPIEPLRRLWNGHVILDVRLARASIVALLGYDESKNLLPSQKNCRLPKGEISKWAALGSNQ